MNGRFYSYCLFFSLLLLQSCVNGTVEETRFSTFHRSVQVAIDSAAAEDVADFSETASHATNTQVLLSMKVEPAQALINDITFRIEFSNIPPLGSVDSTNYDPMTNFGFNNDFIIVVIEPVADDPDTTDVDETGTRAGQVVADSKSATLKSIAFNIDDTTVSSGIAENETLSSTIAFSYSITFDYQFVVDDVVTESHNVLVTGEAHFLIKHYEEKSKAF